MNSALKAIVLCVIIILVVLLALALIATWRRRMKGGASGGVDCEHIGGSQKANEQVEVPAGLEASKQKEGHTHELGVAMHEYALGMGEKNLVGVHNLAHPRYSEVESADGGSKASASHRSHKAWDEYQTWTELSRNQEASAEYMKDRAKALNDLQFDWSQVLATVTPLLEEDREYIGLISPEKNGTTMRVVSMEASPTRAGDDKSPNVFASVPPELVEKMSARPALYIFHTHPSDRRANPLPSPADVSTAITMGYAGVYAANLVISRYGVILYTLGWGAYKNIHQSKSPELAMRHLRYDVASFLLGIRSWGDWSLDDYKKAYERYQLLFVVYPSAEYTAASHLLRFRSDVSSPSDFEFLDILRESIEHSKTKKPRKIKDAEH